MVPGNHTIQGGSRRGPVAISSEEQRSLQSELTLKSTPADDSALREAWWLWQVVDEARSAAANIAAMDREAQKRLEAEIRARLNVEAIRPRLERILTLPEIQRTLDEYGVADPLKWLDEAS